MSAYIDYTRLLIEVGLTRIGVQIRDERGAMSTEAAVLTGVLVAIAVAAGLILIAKMRSNAEAIPDNVPTPRTPGPGDVMVLGAKRRGEGGLTSTELAVVMPVLIALVLVPFQIALWWHAHQIADAAAREAVDTAQVVTATEDDGIRAAEWFLDAAGNITEPQVTVTRTTETVTVEVTGRAPRLLPDSTGRSPHGLPVRSNVSSRSRTDDPHPP